MIVRYVSTIVYTTVHTAIRFIVVSVGRNGVVLLIGITPCLIISLIGGIPHLLILPVPPHPHLMFFIIVIKLNNPEWRNRRKSRR